MRYLKVLGLTAVVSAALLPAAGGASATTLTSPTGTVYTGAVHFANVGHFKFSNPIANIECATTVEGQVKSHGSGTTVNLQITSRLFSSCTNNWHTTTVSPGSYVVHWKGEGEGTVTSNGVKVDATRLGITCVYQTNETDLGQLTDSHKTGGHARLDVIAQIPISLEESSGLCGTGNIKWEGTYTLDAPSALYIDS